MILMVDLAASEVFLVAISRAGLGRRSHSRAAIGFPDGFVAGNGRNIFRAAIVGARCRGTSCGRAQQK
jgi:hypothetical protein